MSPFHSGMNHWQRQWLSDRLHRKSKDTSTPVAYHPAPANIDTQPNRKPRKHPDIAKVNRLKPTPTKALELLEQASHKDSAELVGVVLTNIPREQLNNTPRNSSSALERFVARSCLNLPGSNSSHEEHLTGIELLLDAGARWNPPSEEIRSVRRSLLGHDARYVVQILRLLLYTAQAADIEQFLEICRSKSLEDKIATVDRPLVDEIKALRKSKRSQSPSSIPALPGSEPLPTAASNP
jgi:hypothetical protein